MKAVYKRELRSYFNSMVGYVFIAILLFVVGLYFLGNNLMGGYPKFSVTLSSVLIVFMVAIPILTMKSMADERRSRTDQMLLTYPVSLVSVVMGKYLAMVTVLAIPMVLFCLCPVIIGANGTAYFAGDYASILAFFLMGCVFIAVGMFISSLTESQIIAAVGTFAALLLVYLWGDVATFFPEPVSTILASFTFRDVFSNFADYNVFDLGGLVLYLSIAALFIFLTVQTLRKRRGGQVAVLTVLAIILAVVVNLIVGQVPSNYKEFDISDSRIYSVSDTSKAYLAGLQEDVELVVTASEEDTDARIAKFLRNYAALSDKISLRFVDPVAYPSILEEYETQMDAVAVRCTSSGKTTTVPFMDMIVYDETYLTYYQQYVETGFDAEGQITSAIDYVISDSKYVIYQTTGHGETTLPSTVTDAIEKANLQLDSVSMLMDGGIPEDCSLLLVAGPSSDLADDELEMVRTYMQDGGQVMLLLGETTDLPNWSSLLGEYGLEMADGFIADLERYYQEMNNPYAIFPTLSTSSTITSGMSSNDLVLLLYSCGLIQTEPARDTITVTPFMTTSANALAVSLEAQDGVAGTYVLGAVAQEENTRLTVISSISLVDESILSTFTNTVNLNVFMSALTDGFEDVSDITIPAKSLSVQYNMVDNARIWGLIYTVLAPVLVVVVGLLYWNKRRKQ